MADAIVLDASSAQAKAVIYTARAGDTVESIAADYYGNRSLALYVLEGNGLTKGSPIKAGQQLHIPTAFHYRLHKGDTLDGLSKRFLDTPRRAPFLAAMNNIKVSDRLHEGQELTIPFQFVHRPTAPESLQSIAQAFYGDSSRAKFLADYNFRTAPVVSKGEKLVVPISNVRVRSVRIHAVPTMGEGPESLEMNTPALQAAPVKEAQRREAELAERVGALLSALENSYKAGQYSEVAGSLDKLLTEEDPSEAQLAEIFRLKAFAYVALDLPDLATQAFREVIARKPDLKLDEATVSPKIRAALDRARRAPKP